MGDGSGGQRRADDVIPRLPPGFVRRERLITLLDSLADVPLIIVRGPAGAGKSSFVADWARQRAAIGQTVWVSLNGRAMPHAVFWSEIAGASVDPSLVVSTGAAAAAYLNQRREPTTVVVDDFHQASPGLADEVAKFAQLLQRGQVLILTRTAGRLESPLHVIQTGTAVVTAGDLALTAEETALLPRSAELDLDDPARLVEMTGGHPLLTRLMLAIPDNASPPKAARIAGNWAAQLVRPEQLGFALRLALIPIVTVDLARLVCEDPTADRTLEEFATDGLGTHEPDGSFVFHRLIGTALRQHARSTLTDEVRHKILAVAAAHMRGVPEYAEQTLRLLIETRQYSELWPHFATYFTDSLPGDAMLAIDTLPPDAVASDGTVAALSALVQSGRDVTPSAELLAIVDTALTGLRHQPAPGNTEAAVYRELAVLSLLSAAGKYEAGGERAARLLRLTTDLGPGQRPAAKQAAWWGLLHASVTLTLAGRLGDAERLLDEQEPDCHVGRKQRRTIQRAFIHAMRGEVALAERLLESQGDIAPDSPRWTATQTIARAVIQLEHGDAARARDALRMLEHLPSPVREWPYAIIVTARTHIARDPLAGIEDVDRLLHSHAGQPVSRAVRDLLSSAVADLALATGDVPRARRLVADRGDRDVAMRLTAARIALHAPNQETVEDLRRLTEQEDLWPRLRAQALQLLAVHLYRLGNLPSARDALRRALAVTGNHGISLVLALVPLGDLEGLAAAADVELPKNLSRGDHLEQPLAPIGLTRREAHLLLRLATTSRLSDIASSEFVTLSTIKSQAASLYRKLGVTTRLGAVDAAYRRGLIDPRVRDDEK